MLKTDGNKFYISINGEKKEIPNYFNYYFNGDGKFGFSIKGYGYKLHCEPFDVTEFTEREYDRILLAEVIFMHITELHNLYSKLENCDDYVEREHILQIINNVIDRVNKIESVEFIVANFGLNEYNYTIKFLD